MSFNLDDAVALATFAHRHQLDKAGLKYINHPIRVMESVKQQGVMPYVQMAAVLHDVIEDTPFTAEILLALGVPEATVEIVTLVSKVPGQSNEDYYRAIRLNDGARIVKLSDMEDNSQQWRLSYLPVETQDRLRNKYDKGRKFLTFKLD